MMNERDIEMREQNDPLEHAAHETDASTEASETDVEAGRSPSSSDPEMRRDGVPDGF